MWDSDQYKNYSKFSMNHHHHLQGADHHHRKEQTPTPPPRFKEHHYHQRIVSSSSSSASSSPSSPWSSPPFPSSPSSMMKKANDVLKVPKKQKRLKYPHTEEEKRDVTKGTNSQERSAPAAERLLVEGSDQGQKSNLNFKHHNQNIIQMMEGQMMTAQMMVASSSSYSSSMGADSESSSEEELEFDSSYEEEEEERHRQRFLSMQELKRLKLPKQEQKTVSKQELKSTRITHHSTRKRSRNHHGSVEQPELQQQSRNIDLIDILSSSMECSNNGVSELSPSAPPSPAQNTDGRGAASPDNQEGESSAADNGMSSSSSASSSSSSNPSIKNETWRASASSLSISFRPPLLSLSQEEHLELSNSLLRKKKKNSATPATSSMPKRSTITASKSLNDGKNNVGCAVTLHVNCHSSGSEEQREEIRSAILEQATSMQSLSSLVEEKIHTNHQNPYGNRRSSQSSSSSSSISFSAANKNQLLTILDSRKVSAFKIQKKQKVNTSKDDYVKSGSAPFIDDNKSKHQQQDKMMCNPNIYAECIKSLICSTTDDLNTIMDAVVTFRDFNTSGHHAMGKDELSWWSYRSPSPLREDNIPSCRSGGVGTRNLAFLRRMLLPICCHVVIVQNHGNNSQTQCKKKDPSYAQNEKYGIKDDTPSRMTSRNENISVKCKLLSKKEAIPLAPSRHLAVDLELDFKKHGIIYNHSIQTTSTNDAKQSQITHSSVAITTEKKLCSVPYSLIDVLLQIKHLQPLILSALLYRVYQLDEGIYRTKTASTTTTVEDKDSEVILHLHRNLRNLILSTIEKIPSIVDKSALIDMISSILLKSSQKDKLRNDLCNAIPNLLSKDDITDQKIEERQRKMLNLLSSDIKVGKVDRKRKRREEIAIHHHLDWWGDTNTGGVCDERNKSGNSMKPVYNQSQAILHGVGDSRGAAISPPLMPLHRTCDTTSIESANAPLATSSKKNNKKCDDSRPSTMLIKEQVPVVERCKMEAKSCPDWKRAEVMSIRKEREKILRDRKLMLEKKVNQVDKHSMMKYGFGSSNIGIRRSNRRVKPQGRSDDGSLIISSEDMSIDEFLSRTALMSKVNATLPRLFIPNVSRPTLRRLSISKESLNKLQSLFFDSDGSLNNSVRNDVDMSVKNGYINFENRACLVQRQDKRWQVPFRLHGVGYEVETRAKVEALFRKEGVLIPFRECLHDLGLLFGGTEDQSLHHDTARQITSWVDEKPLTDGAISSLNPVSGWEIDRLEYNDAMSSPVAPSSIIVGLGGNDEVLLGVQKDQIDKVGDGNSCKIHGGLDEIFPIVRQNDHLVVIRARTGCMFTGDFPHAGVRNIRRGTPKDQLMEKFNNKIMDIIHEYPAREHVMRTKAIIDMMCNFSGLDRLCRLHCSTEMLEGNLCIPPNTIGFSECLPNLPDIKCHENDTTHQYYEEKNIDTQNTFGCEEQMDDCMG